MVEGHHPPRVTASGPATAGRAARSQTERAFTWYPETLKAPGDHEVCCLAAGTRGSGGHVVDERVRGPRRGPWIARGNQNRCREGGTAQPWPDGPVAPQAGRMAEATRRDRGFVWRCQTIPSASTPPGPACSMGAGGSEGTGRRILSWCPVMVPAPTCPAEGEDGLPDHVVERVSGQRVVCERADFPLIFFSIFFCAMPTSGPVHSSPARSSRSPSGVELARNTGRERLVAVDPLLRARGALVRQELEASRHRKAE